MATDRRTKVRLSSPGRRVSDLPALLRRLNRIALRLALSIRAATLDGDVPHARTLIARAARIALLGARVTAV